LERHQWVGKLLEGFGALPLKGKRVLDVGCGFGHELDAMRTFGAQPNDLIGMDLLPDRIREATAKFPELEFKTGNAERIDYEDGYFDLILVTTLFSSIRDEHMAQGVAREITRVLKVRGAVLWYDFRYKAPWNRDVRGMPSWRIRSLFPTLRPDLRQITLIPPVSRRLGGLGPTLYPVLSAIPFLRSHYIGLLIKVSPDPQ
jgi:ubiquinone/menaquinone biosynthesis C-methylase UbiE